MINMVIRYKKSYGSNPLWVERDGLYPNSRFTAGFNTRFGGRFIDIE